MGFSFIRMSFLMLILSHACACAEDWKLSEHGAANLDSMQYLQPVPQTNYILETFRFSGEFALKHGDDLRFKLSPLVQADPLNDSLSERYWFEVPEGDVQYKNDGWIFQLGVNTFSWGVTDGYNPLDVVSARRYQDPLKQDKLSAPSLSVKKDVGKFTFEGIYIPLQRKSILPGVQSRWLPRQVLTTTSIGDGTESAQLNLPSQLQYHYNPDQERDQALENNVGFRVQMNGILDGLDASIAGFEGAADAPAIDIYASGTAVQLNPRVILQADPQVGLTPVYYRQRVYGGTLVYAAGSTIFRAETAITRLVSKGQDLNGNSEEFILAAEHPYVIFGKDLTMIYQGTIARHSVPLTNSATALNRIFDRALLLGARYVPTEKLSILLSGLFDTQFHEQLAHVESTYNLTDAWKLGLAGDALWGTPDTPLGQFTNNERVTFTVRTAF
jgi:hypothetical protein